MYHWIHIWALYNMSMNIMRHWQHPNLCLSITARNIMVGNNEGAPVCMHKCDIHIIYIIYIWIVYNILVLLTPIKTGRNIYATKWTLSHNIGYKLNVSTASKFTFPCTVGRDPVCLFVFLYLAITISMWLALQQATCWWPLLNLKKQQNHSSCDPDFAKSIL